MIVNDQNPIGHETNNDNHSSPAVTQSSLSTERPRLFKHLMKKLWKYFIEFNLFATESPTDNQYELQTQRISTRVFILLLIMSSLILFIYTATATSIHTLTIETPTLQQYKQLYLRYSRTLKCPCSQISNKYESFLNIQYSQHPICSSIYVTNQWITYLGLARGVLVTSDFRYLARQMFQALQSLCQRTEESIRISLEQFFSDYHVTDLVIDEELLRLQLDATIHQFITSTTNKFVLSLRMIGNTTKGNALLSGLFTTSFLRRTTGSFVYTIWATYNSCTCAHFSSCTTDAAIYTGDTSLQAWIVPGFNQGCTIVEALRRSDLTCFYNQTCLDNFQAQLNIDQQVDISPLDAATLGRFDTETTIGAIVDELMIVDWKWNDSHAKYYSMCDPRECSYSVVSRDSLIVIVANLFGLIGGLVTALKLIVPRVVWLIRWRCNNDTNRISAVFSIQVLHALPGRLARYLSDLNLFSTAQTPNDMYQLQNQRIATRVFIFIFIWSSYFLLIYNVKAQSMHTFTIDTPSVQEYRILYQRHPETLACPCSQISIKYRSFMNIEYSAHPVCSSIFVSYQWFNEIQNLNVNLWALDFRVQAQYLFEALKYICQLTEESIKIGLDQFYSTNYISAVVALEELLQSQGSATIQKFLDTITNQFLLSLRTIGKTTQINSLASTLFTNAYFLFSGQSNYLQTRFLIYDSSCGCLSRSTCAADARIYDTSSSAFNRSVPGFYIGCYILEALRQSDLHCFYDQYCLDDLITALKINQSVTYRTLDAALLKRFYTDTQIGTLVDSLMIDDWRWNISHEKYYNICLPKECTYTMMLRSSWISIMTKIAGLIGGFITALRIVVPRIIQFIRWLINRKSATSRDVRTLTERWHHFKFQMIQYCKEFNLFSSFKFTTRTENIRAQRIATRIFLITFFISFIVLLIYTAAQTVTHTFTLSTPSLEQYHYLYQLYPQTLSCPCSQISNRYGAFMDIQYSFHPICRSVYVTDEWISDQWFFGDLLYSSDFRVFGTQIFLALQSFCQLARGSIEISLDQFYSINFATALVVHSELLRSQSQTTIQQFIATTKNNFLLSLRLIGNTTQVNGLVSATASNFKFSTRSWSSAVVSEPMIYDGNCSCAHNSSCSTRAVIYINNSLWYPWIVPGFYRGCFISEALKRSDLRCLSNQTCLADLRIHLESKPSISLPTLDLSSSTNFKSDTLLEVIIDALMVDEWKWNISHAKYYTACQPQHCTYSVNGRNDVVVLATTMIGLLGGLFSIEQLIIFYLIKIILKYMDRKRKIKVYPSDSIDSINPQPSNGMKMKGVNSEL